MRICATLALCVLAAGCGANSLASREDREVQSSLQYDGVDCARLAAQRDALAQRHGLSRNAKPAFSDVPTGFGVVTPDLRSAPRRDTEDAAGAIDAMNRSLARRRCPGPAPG
ncbi:MAG TPA: hypothetical protein PKD01_05325 [Mesorhizobium sp.]|nr:hypothetical protein [Mesorhizobium sp.]